MSAVSDTKIKIEQNFIQLAIDAKEILEEKKFKNIEFSVFLDRAVVKGEYKNLTVGNHIVYLETERIKDTISWLHFMIRNEKLSRQLGTFVDFHDFKHDFIEILKEQRSDPTDIIAEYKKVRPEIEREMEKRSNIINEIAWELDYWIESCYLIMFAIMTLFSLGGLIFLYVFNIDKWDWFIFLSMFFVISVLLLIPVYYDYQKMRYCLQRIVIIPSPTDLEKIYNSITNTITGLNDNFKYNKPKEVYYYSEEYLIEKNNLKLELSSEVNEMIWLRLFNVKPNNELFVKEFTKMLDREFLKLNFTFIQEASKNELAFDKELEQFGRSGNTY
jgi:hypothetical protein